MAENLSECQGLVADAVTKIGEINTLIREVKEWCDDSQATVAEMIGTDNEVITAFAAASEKADVVIGLVAGLGVETEYLGEHLTAIA